MLHHTTRGPIYLSLQGSLPFKSSLTDHPCLLFGALLCTHALVVGFRRAGGVDKSTIFRPPSQLSLSSVPKSGSKTSPLLPHTHLYLHTHTHTLADTAHIIGAASPVLIHDTFLLSHRLSDCQTGPLTRAVPLCCCVSLPSPPITHYSIARTAPVRASRGGF